MTAMNQSRAALAAIAVAIPLGMIATVYSGGSNPKAPNDGGRLSVVTSFYPLFEFTQRIAGGRADVSVLVPSGIEPHDWEPTALDIIKAESADLIVINGAGFESWAGRIAKANLVDTSQQMEPDQMAKTNPHIWLDPLLAKEQVDAIRDSMMKADPDNANYYRDNAEKLEGELDLLDAKAAKELSDCVKSDFIVFHDAFTYFAKRYGLTQHSIQGQAPEGEILPQKIEQAITLADKLGINVVYSEDLVDSRIADTIAQEIPGGRVLVLSPIEGISRDEQSQGIGYVDKMKQNIANLMEGLGCR